MRGIVGGYRGVGKYFHLLTASDPSGDIGSAPDNARCTVGDYYPDYPEEEQPPCPSIEEEAGYEGS